MIVFFAWLGFAGYTCSRLSGLTKEEEYLPSSHFIIKAKNLISKNFN